MSNTIQMHRVYIKATPQAIWAAITKPEWTGSMVTRRWLTTTCEPEAGFARIPTRE